MHDIFWGKVEGQETYDIQFSGLPEGEHEFRYVIENEFFDLFEQSEVNQGRIRAEVILEKKTNMLEFWFRLSGTVTMDCDRCLEPFESDIDKSYPLYVKFGEEAEELSEDLVVLSEKSFKINVAHYLFEFIQLSLPVRKVHPENSEGIPTCNAEMINKLKKYTIEQESPVGDPRWKGLEKLLNNKD